MPEATYAAAYQLATTAAFQEQVLIALYAAFTTAATSSDPNVSACSARYLAQNNTDMSVRVALRIADSMPGLTPNDATVQAAVTALIPATGTFTL